MHQTGAVEAALQEGRVGGSEQRCGRAGCGVCGAGRVHGANCTEASGADKAHGASVEWSVRMDERHFVALMLKKVDDKILAKCWLWLIR